MTVHCFLPPIFSGSMKTANVYDSFSCKLLRSLQHMGNPSYHAFLPMYKILYLKLAGGIPQQNLAQITAEMCLCWEKPHLNVQVHENISQSLLLLCFLHKETHRFCSWPIAGVAADKVPQQWIHHNAVGKQEQCCSVETPSHKILSRHWLFSPSTKDIRATHMNSFLMITLWLQTLPAILQEQILIAIYPWLHHVLHGPFKPVAKILKTTKQKAILSCVYQSLWTNERSVKRSHEFY